MDNWWQCQKYEKLLTLGHDTIGFNRDENTAAVSYPYDKALIFDIEMCMREESAQPWRVQLNQTIWMV